jgi:hypothetical protein
LRDANGTWGQFFKRYFEPTGKFCAWPQLARSYIQLQCWGLGVKLVPSLSLKKMPSEICFPRQVLYPGNEIHTQISSFVPVRK